MKIAGYRAVASDIKRYGIDHARMTANALILDSVRGITDEYKDGYVAGFNKAVKK